MDARWSPEVPHPADHDHHEGSEGEVEAHGVVDPDEGSEEDAARRRHGRADGEHPGVHRAPECPWPRP